MKNLTSFVILIFLLSCQKLQPINDEKVTVIRTNLNSFNPSKEDLNLAKKLIIKRLEVYNNEQKAQDLDFNYVLQKKGTILSKMINLEEYYIQFIPEIYNNEKIISANCLCDISDEKLNWKTEVISIKDGGKCYFGISVNLTRKIVFGFNINGSS